MSLSTKLISHLIYLVRGQKVLLDEDLAKLYGVTTGALVQAVKRNQDRLPEDFAFQLSIQELRDLKSQFVISSSQPIEIINVNDNSGTPDTHGGRRSRPLAFTEQGVAMMASVLNSSQAIRVNIEIVRAFVRMRQMIASNSALFKKLEELERKYDSQFKVVFNAIRQLMLPPDPKKKGRLGFG